MKVLGCEEDLDINCTTKVDRCDYRHDICVHNVISDPVVNGGSVSEHKVRKIMSIEFYFRNGFSAISTVKPKNFFRFLSRKEVQKRYRLS